MIKAGALDCLPGNRRQKMAVYIQVVDRAGSERKNSIAGQLSLFDIAGEEEKEAFSLRMPDLPEFEEEQLLGFEKEVLGIYLSGHPLMQYRDAMEKMITARTTDFLLDEETGRSRVTDGQRVILGGMITEKTVKFTKNNKMMAFVTLEDLVGTVEIIVFPRDYEQWNTLLNEEAKVYIQGRVSAEDDKNSKLIFERMRTFDDVPKDVWFQFADKASYDQAAPGLLEDLKKSPGSSSVVIFLKEVRAVKRLPGAYGVSLSPEWLSLMQQKYGEANVKVVQRVLKNL